MGIVSFDSHCYSVLSEIQWLAYLERAIFKRETDQAVFKLNGIVVLVHQLPNLKRILFKKRSVFHLPYAEYCMAV